MYAENFMEIRPFLAKLKFERAEENQLRETWRKIIWGSGESPQMLHFPCLLMFLSIVAKSQCDTILQDAHRLHLTKNLDNSTIHPNKKGASFIIPDLECSGKNGQQGQLFESKLKTGGSGLPLLMFYRALRCSCICYVSFFFKSTMLMRSRRLQALKLK